MKKKKHSNRKKWKIIGGIITTLIICTAISIIFLINLLNGLSNLGEFMGNTCSDEPRSVEGMARFDLPPSYDNLTSFCGGMQGWWAEAHFDMSPDDLDMLINSLWLEMKLSEFSDGLDDDMKQHLFISEEDNATIKTGFYGYSESGNDLVQKILIDTTNPELYRVYLVVLGG